MKNNFTKSDLRNGMIVEYRDGEKALFIKDRFIGADCWEDINAYTDNLFFENEDGWKNDCDIIKVYNINDTNELYFISKIVNILKDNKYLELIWERIENK